MSRQMLGQRLQVPRLDAVAGAMSEQQGDAGVAGPVGHQPCLAVWGVDEQV